MNRKKVLDYTVTRRNRDRHSRDNRDQKDRGSSGDKPFWSNDDKNLIEKRGDASIRQLQDRITRKLLSPDIKSNYNTSRRTDDTRGRSKDTRVHGPIIDEFSEDAYNMRHDSKSQDLNSRDSKDRRSRNRKDSPSGKRTNGSGRSSYRDESPSRLKKRENTQSRSSSKISGGQSNEDLRDLLKIYQKSKWDEDTETAPEKVRSGQQDKYDYKRKKDVGVSSSTGLFTMSTQGTLVSIPLDPPSDTREFLSREFDRDDYRDNDNWRSDLKDKRESRDSSYSRTRRSRTSVKTRRSSLERELRDLSKDQEIDNLRYKQYDSLQMKPAEIERNLPLGIQAEPDYFETLGDQGMIKGDLRNIPISELARKSGKKFQSAFELGRPFFGTAGDSKEEGWQGSEFADSSRRGSLSNRPTDSDFSSDFDRDDNLSLLKNGKDVLTDNQGRRSPARDLSKSSRSRSGKTAYTSDKRDKNDRQSDWSTIADKYKVTQATVLPTKSGEETSKAAVLPSSKPSLTLASQKGGAKSKFPAGFLPRQVKALAKNSGDSNIERSVRKIVSSTKPQSADQESTSLEPLPLKRAGRGYIPRFVEKSQSRSPRRSKERVDDKKDESSVGTSTREVKLPSKPKFTSQNWLHLDSRDSKPPNLVGKGAKNSRGRGGPLGRGSLFKAHGRGGAHPGNSGKDWNPTKSQGSLEALSIQGSVRGRGRGVLRGRGRAFMRGRGGVVRGRGFIPRGRARGTAPRGKAQVGITVRNIFRRSRSLSASSSESRCRRRSVSPSRQKENHRNDKKSKRSHSRSRSWSRSRSRSRSYCSTCSSGSCSTCASRHSSPERPSRRHSRQSKTNASVKKESAKKVDRESEKSLERIKADIKIMEEELQKKVKGSVQPELKQERNDEGKVKDKPRWLKDALMSKELSKDASNKVKKESEKTKREVILKSDKLKELAVSKNSKGSPARDVKIISKGHQGGEKEASKLKIDKLEITIDRLVGGSGLKRDQAKQQQQQMKEKIPEVSRKLSRSSPSKGKKKEKSKSKKTSKKSKKKKRYIDSGESEVDSDYSEELISRERKRKTEESMDSDKTLDLFERNDVRGINVHYEERRKPDASILNDLKNVLTSDGSGAKNHPTRRNLISIPLPKEPDVIPKGNLQKRPKLDQAEGRVWNVPLSKASMGHPAPFKQEVETSDAPYPETGLADAKNVDWGTEGYVEDGYNESSLADQAYSDFYEGTQETAQDEIVNQEEGADYENYYYEEGAEGGYYEEEYYTYQQEGDWQGDDQAVAGDEPEGEHQEWQEPEYIEQGQEEEQYGQYYIGEDGQYYWVEGEAYEGQEGVEYAEEEAEAEVYDDAEQGYAVDDEQYGYEYAAEDNELQSEESGAHQLEGWGEVEGEWGGEYQEGHYYEDGSEWAEGYAGEYEGVEQQLPSEGQEGAQEAAYSAEEGYEQQLVPDQYYKEHDHAQEVVHDTEQANVQNEEFEVHPDHTETGTTPTSSTTSSKDSKPLKSILKKPQAQPGNLQKSKLVSERLAQLKKQSVGMLRTSPSVQSQEPVKEQGTKARQGDIAEGTSEADEHREMEEAILASQSTDTIGTEYVVRVHGSGTANFFCKLCQCHFNTVTAKNLHIKGAKHIELYVRLKSSLLKSAIKDTLPETAKRSAQEQPPVLQKFPRRF